MKTIYLFNPITKVFTTARDIEDGDVIPNYGTEVAPPTLGNNQTALFQNGQWLVISDFRKALFWVKATGEIVRGLALGSVPDESLTTIPHPGGGAKWVNDGWEMDLSVAKSARIASNNAITTVMITTGFTSDALGEVHTYPSGLTDQQNLSTNVVASLIPGLPDEWTVSHLCADGNGVWAYRPHTAAQIRKVGADAHDHITAILERNASLRAQVAQATTLADIEAAVMN